MKLINDIIKSERNVVVISDRQKGKSRNAQILARTALEGACSFAKSLIFYKYEQRPIVEGIKSNKNILFKKSITKHNMRGTIIPISIFDDVILETKDKYSKYISYLSTQTKIVCFVDHANLEQLPIDISACDVFLLL